MKNDCGHRRDRVDQGKRRADRGHEDQGRLSLDHEITPQSRNVREGVAIANHKRQFASDTHGKNLRSGAAQTTTPPASCPAGSWR